MRSGIPVLLIVAVFLGGLVAAANASSDEPLARLHGRAISLSQVPDFHCHDGRWPAIDCFTSEDERDSDALAHAQSLQESMASLADASLQSASLFYYVTFYDNAGYGGASYTTWQPIENLNSIYWNDIVSSFKSLNGQRPKWFVHANYGAPSHQWAAGAWVSYVGDTANDRFSSVKNVP